MTPNNNTPPKGRGGGGKSGRSSTGAIHKPQSSGDAAADDSEEHVEPKVVVRDRRRIDPATGALRPPADMASQSASSAPNAEPAQASASKDDDNAASSEAQAVPQDTNSDEAQAATDAELAAVRTQLEERTADLQRVSAEYANYRRRIDRERASLVEQSTAVALTSLLPALDDIERARAHGDLSGAFGTVAEQLLTSLSKLGLSSFGKEGDAFDPTWHEAVMHSVSADVSEPTCVQVLRQGYVLGEKMLRPALVAVADPDGGSAEPPSMPADLGDAE